MFTGIVQSLGTISTINYSGKGAEITIEAKEFDFSDVNIGDSIACNGVCLTVVKIIGKSFVADISHETVECTTFKNQKKGSIINLEKALTPSTHMGGHIVQGHVDGLGVIHSINRTDNALDIWIAAPQNIAKYIAMKGSITVNGISLTVNEVNGSAFRLTLIPHIHDVTNVFIWKKGDSVNIEVDVLARYLERLMSFSADTEGKKKGKNDSILSAGFLAENGFM